MTVLDEAEERMLEDSVSLAERLMGEARMTGALPSIYLAERINSAHRRIEALHAGGLIGDSREEKKRSHTLDLAIAVKVAREDALSHAERIQYAEFLRVEHFRKSDFDQLAAFYSHSWERLSKEGKNEMSERVWNGVRQGEYTFDELPQVVREAEAKELRKALTGKAELPQAAPVLSEQEQKEFVTSVDGGKMDLALQILDQQTDAKSTVDLGRDGIAEEVHEPTAVTESQANAAGLDGLDWGSPQKPNELEVTSEPKVTR